jgi:uncharacterized membrane protein (DUF373 family)
MLPNFLFKNSNLILIPATKKLLKLNILVNFIVNKKYIYNGISQTQTLNFIKIMKEQKQEQQEDKFVKPILFVNKLIIKFLICILTICLILSAVHLVIVVFGKITAPPFLIFEVATLYDVFSLILIVAIGFELIKSLLIIVSSETIPSFPIVQIGIIAVANKIITLDIKHTDFYTLLGLAALMAGLGITYFFHKFKTPEQEIEK